MASYQEVRPLPKFGEWDVNDPASAEGFSGIFNRARNEKVAWCPSSGNVRSMRRHNNKAGKSRSAVVVHKGTPVVVKMKNPNWSMVELEGPNDEDLFIRDGGPAALDSPDHRQHRRRNKNA